MLAVVVGDSIEDQDGERELGCGESVFDGAIPVDLELTEVGQPGVGSFDDPAALQTGESRAALASFVAHGDVDMIDQSTVEFA